MNGIPNSKKDLWRQINKLGADDCWEWSGCLSATGYGVISYKGKRRSTHRLSYIFTFGRIPKGMYVCHTCDNRKCCNPNHLFLGSPNDNNQDMISKGRMRIVYGEDRRHKVTEKEVISLREEYASGTVSHRDLAVRYGISNRNVSAIIRGETWKHLL